MPSNQQSPYTINGHKAKWPWLILVVSLIVTVIGWRLEVARTDEYANSSFNLIVDRARFTIQKRLQEYKQVLEGCEGLFNATGRMDRKMWREYVRNLNLEEVYPGVEGIGFAMLVKGGEESAHEAVVRAEGFPEYSIRPHGPQEEHFPITYIEPFNPRNQKAFGYDMFSEPVRREAMIRARDTGKPAISGKVVPSQEGANSPQSGFLMYLPLYAPTLPHETAEERRKALVGFVYAPFQMKNFMMGALEGDNPWMPQHHHIDIEIYDGAQRPSSLLTYDSDPGDKNITHKTLERVLRLPLYGKVWTLRLTSKPEFDRTIDYRMSWAILLCGSVFSLLLFVTARALMAARADAVAIARVTSFLQESEERFRKFSDAAFEGVVIADKGVIVDANHTFEEMTGRQHSEIVGTKILDLIAPESRATAEANITANSGKPYESSMIRKDGARIFVEINGKSIAHNGNQARVKAIRDITDRKLAEEELRGAKEKAEAATKLKDKFVSLVAHDLRSPFASIIGLIDLISSDENEPLTPKGKLILDRVLQSGRNQMRMIDELLKISMLQTGKITLKKRFLDVGALVTSLAVRLQGVAESKGVEIVNAVPSGAIFHVDYNLFTQVLQNLIVNAIKFSKVGDKVTVFVPDGRRDTIAVRDTGVGVKKEFLPKLFNHEDKTTSRGTSGEMGTGLGLPFANDIIKAHDGTLTVESEEGKGSVFYVQAPQVKPVVMITGETSCEELAAVEGNLEKNGITFVVKQAVDEACDAIKTNPPHLVVIFLDPVSDEGFSLLANLKKTAGMKDIPVMAITSETDVNTLEKAMSYGVDGFIRAPFDPQNFVSLVMENLSGGLLV